VGSAAGGYVADRVGRKKSLIAVGIMYMVSSLWSGLATDPWTFMIARFIGGVGVGIACVAAPLFISEIAPPELRGGLTGLFQGNIVFGILVAYMSNLTIAAMVPKEYAWRWMLGIEALPAAIYSGMTSILPESPRWLLGTGEEEAAIEVIKNISPDLDDEEVRKQVEEIQEGAKADSSSNPAFFTKRLTKPIQLAFFMAFFNQASGINAVLYFAPSIFEEAGLASEDSLLNSVGIGVANLLATVTGVYLIDRIGRRSLMYIGSFGYIMTLFTIAWAFHSNTVAIIPWGIFLFVFSHAVGQGTCIWVFVSEIFPSQHRGKGMAFGSLTHWVIAALLTMVFPTMRRSLYQSTIFCIFGSFCVLQLVWVHFVMPETKGLALEQVQIELGIATKSELMT